jgi:colanic acid/amylovoran biosynthesis glycosyltransferase
MEAVLLAGLLRKFAITHIHNHLGDSSGTITMLASRLADITFSISVHGPHIFFDAPSWALNEKARHSTFIACIGYFCRSQMMLNVDKEHWNKLQIVRCGVDTQSFEFRLPERMARHLTYTGRLSVEKGLPVLLESLSDLVRRGFELRLSVLGDGPDRGFLESYAHRIGVSAHVDFLGYVDQATIRSTLRASDMFVLPSFAEGIPVALMEAMASGVPVIATQVGGVSELIVDGKTGQVVGASDRAGLTEAIARYARDLDFCRKVAVGARSMVEAEFEIHRQVDVLAGLFDPSTSDRMPAGIAGI